MKLQLGYISEEDISANLLSTPISTITFKEGKTYTRASFGTERQSF